MAPRAFWRRRISVAGRADVDDASRERQLSDNFPQIDVVLARIERLAAGLRADPDGDVRRSTIELRAAFDTRNEIEPALARVRSSVNMLRTHNHDGSRREFQRRAHGVDHLEQIVENELVPELRRVGFDV